MKSLGIWLMVFGFGSVVLNFMGLEFRLLMWVDSWGPTIGWGIRAALALAGVVVFILGSRQVQQAQKAA